MSGLAWFFKNRIFALSTAFISSVGASITGANFLGAFEFLDAILPKTAEEFKSNGKDEYCVKNYFPGLNLNVPREGGIEQVFFPSNSFQEDELGGRSCLTVNWKADGKEEYFRFLWTFTSGNKGFVMFNTVSSQNSSKIAATGVLYSLTADGSGLWSSTEMKSFSLSSNCPSGPNCGIFGVTGSFEGFTIRTWKFSSSGEALGKDIPDIQGQVSVDGGPYSKEYGLLDLFSFRGSWEGVVSSGKLPSKDS